MATARTVTIPLVGEPWAELSAPFPLTPEAWERLMDLLAAMKPGLVDPAPTPIAPGERTGT